MPSRASSRTPSTRRAVPPSERPEARSKAGSKPGSKPGSKGRADARPSDVHEKLYVATSDLHGLGMFASGRLAADVVLGRLAGMPTYDDGTYVLWLTDELGLEVTNDFRFINHSKSPNCALTDVDVVTLKAIAVDEELTHDYGWP